MDDWKLFAKDDDNMEGLQQTVKNISNDIGRKFGLNKWAKAIFERGRLLKPTPVKIQNNTTINSSKKKEFTIILASMKAIESNMPP